MAILKRNVGRSEMDTVKSSKGSGIAKESVHISVHVRANATVRVRRATAAVARRLHAIARGHGCVVTSVARVTCSLVVPVGLTDPRLRD